METARANVMPVGSLDLILGGQRDRQRAGPVVVMDVPEIPVQPDVLDHLGRSQRDPNRGVQVPAPDLRHFEPRLIFHDGF